MKSFFLPLSLLLSLPSALLAARLTISIPPSPQLPNPSILPSSTHATLSADGAPLSAPITRANAFSFDSVVPGSYLLNVHCRDFAFEPLRIDVVANETAGGGEYVSAWQTFRGNEWDNKGEMRGEGPGDTIVVVEVKALGPKMYYQNREGFSILTFLKSPMILMALFSMGLIFGMPYLLENMDPEARAEFEEIQKQSPLASASNPAAQLQNFDFASWMAGRSQTPEPTSQAASHQPQRQVEGARQAGQGGAKRKA